MAARQSAAGKSLVCLARVCAQTVKNGSCNNAEPMPTLLVQVEHNDSKEVSEVSEIRLPTLSALILINFIYKDSKSF